MTRNHSDIEPNAPHSPAHYLRTPYSSERDYVRHNRQLTRLTISLCFIAVSYFLILSAPLIIPAVVAALAEVIIHI